VLTEGGLDTRGDKGFQCSGQKRSKHAFRNSRVEGKIKEKNLGLERQPTTELASPSQTMTENKKKDEGRNSSLAPFTNVTGPTTISKRHQENNGNSGPP